MATPDELKHRAEMVALILEGVGQQVYLYETHRPTFAELMVAQDRASRSAMLISEAVSAEIQVKLTELLELAVDSGDADGILFVMLEAERIGLASWSNEKGEWEWRR